MTLKNRLMVRYWLLLILMFGASTAVSETKTIGIVVFDGVLTSDITAPIEVFGEASHQSWFSDYRVITISASDSTLIKTEHGISINADTTILKNPKVDVLLLPSAYNMKPILKNKRLIEFITKNAKTVDWIASNCSGAFLLGKAGLLGGKKATTWAGGEGDLEKAFPEIKVQWNKNVVVDGNIITSNGSLVSYEAAFVLLSKMSSSGKANEVAEALQYTRIAKALTLPQ
ncbi:transcriptional regulator [Gammaproteobacteria bacterium 42_54_T18]|nr:transcriptional regulator [Gammaproteobacteria bacterium 42_54_T18]